MPGQQLPTQRLVPAGVATSGHEITGSLPPHEFTSDTISDADLDDETDEPDGGRS
jgi:hypothetical protein